MIKNKYYLCFHIPYRATKPSQPSFFKELTSYTILIHVFVFPLSSASSLTSYRHVERETGVQDQDSYFKLNYARNETMRFLNVHHSCHVLQTLYNPLYPECMKFMHQEAWWPMITFNKTATIMIFFYICLLISTYRLHIHRAYYYKYKLQQKIS